MFSAVCAENRGVAQGEGHDEDWMVMPMVTWQVWAVLMRAVMAVWVMVVLVRAVRAVWVMVVLVRAVKTVWVMVVLVRAVRAVWVMVVLVRAVKTVWVMVVLVRRVIGRDLKGKAHTLKGGSMEADHLIEEVLE
jgi:hypothetical protein